MDLPTSAVRVFSRSRVLKLSPKLSKQPTRSFRSTPSTRTSPFFQLGALANSRETRWLSKSSGTPQIEHSPQLQLIRSSEVEPFQKKLDTTKAPPPPVKRTRLLRLGTKASGALEHSVGRAILARHSQERRRLVRRARKASRALMQEKDDWRKERTLLQMRVRDSRIFVGLIFLCGVSIALAFLPNFRVPPQSRGMGDSSALPNTGNVVDSHPAEHARPEDMSPSREARSSNWTSWFWKQT